MKIKCLLVVSLVSFTLSASDHNVSPNSEIKTLPKSGIIGNILHRHQFPASMAAEVANEIAQKTMSAPEVEQLLRTRLSTRKNTGAAQISMYQGDYCQRVADAIISRK